MKKLISFLLKAAVCIVLLAVGIHAANTALEIADPWKDKIPEKLRDVGSPYKFYYDNGFLIMDRNEIYVLQTAGKNWVYQKFPLFRRCAQRG